VERLEPSFTQGRGDHKTAMAIERILLAAQEGRHPLLRHFLRQRGHTGPPEILLGTDIDRDLRPGLRGEYVLHLEDDGAVRIDDA